MIERAAIQSLADEIASKFDVERIILFGSYAYGAPTEDSDVDLLILMEFEGRPREQRRLISPEVSHDFPRDLLVRTPDDAAQRFEQFDPIIREAFLKGEVLYDRQRCAMAQQS